MIEALLRGRFWLWKVALLGVVVSFIFAAPRLDQLFFSENSYRVVYQELFEREIRLPIWGNWEAIYEKVEHPLRMNQYPPASHQGKIGYRLTGPLIIAFLGLSPFHMILLQYLVGLLTFYLIGLLVYKACQSKIHTAFVVLLTSLLYLGNASTGNILAQFDCLAYFFVLLALCMRSRVLSFVSLILAAFCDERVFLSIAMIVLHQKVFPTKQVFAFSSSVSLLALATYFLLRQSLGINFGLDVPVGDENGVSLNLIFRSMEYWWIGAWSVFKGGWFLILLSWFPLFQKCSSLSARGKLGSYILTVAVSIMCCFVVFDITRSLSYLFPMFLYAASNVPRGTFIDRKRLYLGVIFVTLATGPIYVVAQPIAEFGWTSRGLIVSMLPLPLRIIEFIYYVVL
jgi:hypothetical protein